MESSGVHGKWIECRSWDPLRIEGMICRGCTSNCSTSGRPDPIPKSFPIVYIASPRSGYGNRKRSKVTQKLHSSHVTFISDNGIKATMWRSKSPADEDKQFDMDAGATSLSVFRKLVLYKHNCSS